MQCPEGPDRVWSGPSDVGGAPGGLQVPLSGARLEAGAAVPASSRASFAARALPPRTGP